jgi:hypothetical protein
MEHDEAVRSQAAERYVSHELSAPERKAFEEHFFQCQRCADEVRFELTFAANVRAVTRESRVAAQPAPAPLVAGSWQKWRVWLRPRSAMAFSFAVNFALVAGLGYALLTRAHPAARPQLIAAYFAPGLAHGANDVHALPAGQTFYAVLFPVPGSASRSYTYEILPVSGPREASGSVTVSPAAEGNSFCLQVPIEGLPAGIHTLIVRGPGGETVSWSQFRSSN